MQLQTPISQGAFTAAPFGTESGVYMKRAGEQQRTSAWMGLKRRIFGPATRSDPSINCELELFAGLNEDELDAAANVLSVFDVAPGSVLGRQGSSFRDFTVIVSGQVVVSQDSVPVGILGPGCWFGAYAIGPDGPRRRAVSFDAIAPTRVAVADPRGFTALMQLELVAERVHVMIERRREFNDRPETAKQSHHHLEEHTDYPAHL